MSTPRVAVLVLNQNGREHLDSCLLSLEAQVYPRDRFEIEVVDNGSTDGSAERVRERFPGVQLLQFETNRGFSAAYNTAITQCSADFVALLNNDTRVEPTWLTELVTVAERHQASVVGSKILDWSGERIDFVGGDVSFVGHSWQRDFQAPATREYGENQLLFACAGSMLAHRQTFLDAGGFDDEFFAYFEDVDLGWRLSLLGYKTVLAPKAVTYHRLHGTSSRLAFAQRLRLYERNALAMIFKNYEAATLERVLPVAVALALMRGLSGARLDSSSLQLGGKSVDSLDLEPRTVAHLIALEDFCRQLPQLAEKRAVVQRKRRRSDADLIPLFGEPLRLHELGTPYEETARALIRDFGIDELFSRPARSPAKAADTFQVAATGAQPVCPSGQPTVQLTPFRLPRVSVVILTALGPTHLRECLASLQAQTYPPDRREVIVVDNGSSVDPTAVVEQYYPGAKVIRNATNLGFSAGNNIGARAADGEYLIFLNDDTRAHPDWIRELVATARRRNAASVATRILTWDGRAIDFVDAAANFEGKGFQIGYGMPAEHHHWEERPILSACGAAMLVDRRVLLDTGEWDEGTFAYYEDLELGWRLWLLGHEVWLSPGAIVYHKHHGTSGRWPEAPRLRLYERNSFRILYAHLSLHTLAQVLPAGLLLAADRALLATRLSRAALGEPPRGPDAQASSGRRNLSVPALGRLVKGALAARGARRHRSVTENLRHVGLRGLAASARQVAREVSASRSGQSARTPYLIERGGVDPGFDARMEPVPVRAAAAIAGLREFLLDVPQLSHRRREFQARRQRSDAEILGPFGSHWLDPCPAPDQAEHNAFHRRLVEILQIRTPAPG